MTLPNFSVSERCMAQIGRRRSRNVSISSKKVRHWAQENQLIPWEYKLWKEFLTSDSELAFEEWKLEQ